MSIVCEFIVNLLEKASMSDQTGSSLIFWFSELVNHIYDDISNKK